MDKNAGLDTDRPISTFSTIEMNQMQASADDPWRLTLGQSDHKINDGQKSHGSPSREMIRNANRTAQILLQDKGIKMTRDLRQKIVNYQSDLGY